MSAVGFSKTSEVVFFVKRYQNTDYHFLQPSAFMIMEAFHLPIFSKTALNIKKERLHKCVCLCFLVFCVQVQ